MNIAAGHPSAMADILCLGAGLGGLTTAMLLARDGRPPAAHVGTGFKLSNTSGDNILTSLSPTSLIGGTNHVSALAESDETGYSELWNLHSQAVLDDGRQPVVQDRVAIRRVPLERETGLN